METGPFYTSILNNFKNPAQPNTTTSGFFKTFDLQRLIIKYHHINNKKPVALKVSRIDVRCFHGLHT